MFETMKTNYYIFFSWQSDVKGNKSFIDRSIRNAINEIKTDPDWTNMNITYDHSTMNRSGSPSIVDTIHQKINTCDVFIADVTPIATINGKNTNQEKLIPNPNVMAESGFALRALGENQIIFLIKNGEGDVNDLPFDIRHRRINFFNNNSNFSLVTYIKSALETAKNRNTNAFENNVVTHDKKIYESLAKIIGIEDNLFYHTDKIASSQKISYFQSELFYNIANFIDAPQNQFLIEDINKCAQKFKDSVRKLLCFTAQYFTPLRSAIIKPEPATEEERIEQNKTKYMSWIDKEAGEYPDDETYDKKLKLVLDFMIKNSPEIDQSYRDFRFSIKKNLFL